MFVTLTLSFRASDQTDKRESASRLPEQLFLRITEWDYDDVPKRAILFNKDLPIVDKPLPRFLDDAAATKLMRTSCSDPDPLSRLIVELFARTGIRKTELIQLELNSVVQIGSAFWLRVPIGKLHNDRYLPLHPQLKEMIDDYLANHRPDIRSTRLLVDGRHPLNPNRVVTALSRISHEAGIGHVTPHQLRHTLATQAINRGMSLYAIASLLGHKTLGMTMIYARIADKTVADQHFSVAVEDHRLLRHYVDLRRTTTHLNTATGAVDQPGRRHRQRA